MEAPGTNPYDFVARPGLLRVKLSYDREVDAIVIALREDEFVESDEIAPE